MGKTITGSSTIGVTLSVNPTTITGSIAGSPYGVFGAATKAWTLVNEGSIEGGRGVYFGDGGTVTNAKNGFIGGDAQAIFIRGQVDITNAGTLVQTDQSGTAIYVLDAGAATRITNSAGGVIVGAEGVVVRGTADITNQGLIQAKGAFGGFSQAIVLQSGTVDNAKGGTIIGQLEGVGLGAGTIIDAGLIEATGTSGYAIGLGGGLDELILQTGATLIGEIKGFIANDTIDETGLTITKESFANGVLTLFDQNAKVGTLEFGAGINPIAFNTSAFSLKSDGHGGTDIVLGTETFTGSYSGVVNKYGTVNAAITLAALANIIGSGARITGGNFKGAVYGSAYRDWTLTNQGTIIGDGDGFGVSLAGGGFVSNAAHGLIEGGTGIKMAAGTLVDSGTIIGSAGTAIYLAPGSSGVDIVLRSGAALQGAIYGFVAGDTIDLAGVTATGEMFQNGILTITNGHAVVETIAVDGAFKNASFKLKSVSGGTDIITAPTETFTGHYGVELRLSSPFTSIAATGSFGGAADSVVGKGGPGFTLLNSGTVNGGHDGVYFAGGQVTNAAGGLIGGPTGVDLKSAGLTNAGSIGGSLYGIQQFDTGSASRNLAGGGIYGRLAGAQIDGGSFANAGTIFGGNGVKLINFVYYTTGRVTDATFSNTGRVTGGSSSYYNRYRHTGLYQYSGFASNAASGIIDGPTGVRIDSGVLVNAGTIIGLAGPYPAPSRGLVVAGGVATNTATGTISGTYGVQLLGGTLIDAGTIASTIAAHGTAIAFGAKPATLVLDKGNVIDGAIANFVPGDVIDFAATTITSVTSSGGILMLKDGSAIVEKLSLSGLANPQDFTLISQGAAGTALMIDRDIVSGSYNTAIDLTVPTTITKTGTIDSNAFRAIYGTGILLNQGVVTGTDVAIYVGGGTITNAAGALIDGAADGIVAFGYIGHVAVKNAGTILSNGTGVLLVADDTVTNTGLIRGNTGLYADEFNTITNAGTIASTLAGGTAINLSGQGNELILDAGAKIIGAIAGFSGSDVIDFAKQTISGKKLSDGTLALTDAGVTLATLAFASTPNVGEFTLASDGAGGTRLILGPEIITGTYKYGVTISANYTSIAPGAEVELLQGYYGPNNANVYALVDNVKTPTTIVNAGRIIDTAGNRTGIRAVGATITNAAGGTIAGSGGIRLSSEAGSASSINNAGTIIGFSGGFPGDYGVNLSGGFISNQKTGFITGDTGVFLYNATLSNAGTVFGSEYNGVTNTYAVGDITNLAGGTIEGVTGIYLYEYGTVTNAGTIASSQGASGTAIDFHGRGEAKFIDDPGGVLIGGVTAGDGADVLELGSGASAGTLSGIGESVIGFGAIAFDAKSTWSLRGNAAGLAGGERITGFSPADTIVIDNFSASSFSTIAGGLVLKNSGATITLDITTTLAGAFAIHAAGASTTITAAAANAVSSSDIVSLGALSSGIMNFLRAEARVETGFQSLTLPAHTASPAAAASPQPQAPSIGWIMNHPASPAAVPAVTLHSV
jgi:hypothetical protein